jgi:hypothetical protein
MSKIGAHVVGYGSAVHFVDFPPRTFLDKFYLSEQEASSAHRAGLTFLLTFVLQSKLVCPIFLVRLNRSWYESKDFGTLSRREKLMRNLQT